MLSNKDLFLIFFLFLSIFSSIILLMNKIECGHTSNYIKIVSQYYTANRKNEFTFDFLYEISPRYRSHKDPNNEEDDMRSVKIKRHVFSREMAEYL